MTNEQLGAASPSASAAALPAHGESATPELSGGGMLATWLMSLAAHTLLFVAMFSIPWLTHIVADQETALPIRTAELYGDPESEGFGDTPTPEFSAAYGDPTGRMDPTAVAPDKLAGLAGLAHGSGSGGGEQGSGPAIIGKRGGAGDGLTIGGVGEGGGDFSRLGLRIGSGSGPNFFGLGKGVPGARRIVYVVDKSGSMTDTFDAVRAELIRSISELKRTQKFHVIFFNARADGRPPFDENPPKRLVSAIEARKQELIEFLKGVRPEGSTEPTPAMRRAFDLEPDIIYFLTDGKFDSSLLPELIRLNREKRTRIFTIAYMDEEGRKLLEDIAREHRGEFKFVSENDLPE